MVRHTTCISGGQKNGFVVNEGGFKDGLARRGCVIGINTSIAWAYIDGRAFKPKKENTSIIYAHPRILAVRIAHESCNVIFVSVHATLPESPNFPPSEFWQWIDQLLNCWNGTKVFSCDSNCSFSEPAEACVGDVLGAKGNDSEACVRSLQNNGLWVPATFECCSECVKDMHFHTSGSSHRIDYMFMSSDVVVKNDSVSSWEDLFNPSHGIDHFRRAFGQFSR